MTKALSLIDTEECEQSPRSFCVTSDVTTARKNKV